MRDDHEETEHESLTIEQRAQRSWDLYSPEWLDNRYQLWGKEAKEANTHKQHRDNYWSTAWTFTIQELREAYKTAYMKGVMFKITGEDEKDES